MARGAGHWTRLVWDCSETANCKAVHMAYMHCVHMASRVRPLKQNTTCFQIYHLISKFNMWVRAQGYSLQSLFLQFLGWSHEYCHICSLAFPPCFFASEKTRIYMSHQVVAPCLVHAAYLLRNLISSPPPLPAPFSSIFPILASMYAK